MSWRNSSRIQGEQTWTSCKPGNWTFKVCSTILTFFTWKKRIDVNPKAKIKVPLPIPPEPWAQTWQSFCEPHPVQTQRRCAIQYNFKRIASQSTTNHQSRTSSLLKLLKVYRICYGAWKATQPLEKWTCNDLNCWRSGMNCVVLINCLSRKLSWKLLGAAETASTACREKPLQAGKIAPGQVQFTWSLNCGKESIKTFWADELGMFTMFHHVSPLLQSR
jgi:hypothetical protein